MIADDPVTDPDNEYDENAHIDIVEEIDDVAGFFQNDPVQLQALLDELGEWYSDYMDWLEEEEDE